MLTLALLPPINDWVYIVVYTIYAITILGTIVIIITENRNPVKSTPDTDEESLFMRIESQHVKAVRRNIMCGGTESQQPEYSQ